MTENPQRIERMAKEFEKEIENLWNDIETALESSVNARRILVKALESSHRAVEDIKRFS
jgi:hypothetical protein